MIEILNYFHNIILNNIKEKLITQTPHTFTLNGSNAGNPSYTVLPSGKIPLHPSYQIS